MAWPQNGMNNQMPDNAINLWDFKSQCDYEFGNMKPDII